MFNRLLDNKDSHRVDYVNTAVMGSGRAFGVYIRGRKATNRPYSSEAKHQLYACLNYVKNFLNESDLAAIYVDILNDKQRDQGAFSRMIRDIRKGYVKKVLFADLEEVLVKEEYAVEIYQVSDEITDLELFDLEGNLFQGKSNPVNQLLGV